jgi:glucose/mannose transport system permease protein
MAMPRFWSRGAIYLVLIALALYFLMPIYVLVATGLKTPQEATYANMWQLPGTLNLASFAQAWTLVAPNFWNSVAITVPAAIISSLIGSINGYIFAKWRFRGSNLIFLLFLLGMFLPYQGILIPMVQVLQGFRLYGTLVGVIFIHCMFGIPITALMFRAYYVSVPDELVDAGKIDGCGFFSIYRHILLPISFPAFAVVLLWQFTTIWNDFLIGVVVLSDPRRAPVNVAVNNVTGSFTTEWNVQMAAAVIAALPTIVVYLLLSKLFMRGLLAGALKG